MYCGARDTVKHRLYECHHAAEVRAASASSSLIASGLAAPEDDMFYTRGWAETPAVAKPIVDAIVKYEIRQGNIMIPSDPFGFLPQDGDFYPDGSVIFGRQDILARGGWGVVQVDESGHPIKAIFGTVPRYFACTPVVAEHLALVNLASRLVNPVEARVFPDCKATIQIYNKGREDATVHSSNLAGLWLDIFSQDVRPLGTMSHCKAHRVIDQVPESEKPAVRANDHADVYAKRGAKEHEPSVGDIAAYKVAESSWRSVMQLAVAVLPLWPHAQELFGKLTRAANGGPRGRRGPKINPNPHEFL